jgi:hypothetical protein
MARSAKPPSTDPVRQKLLLLLDEAKLEADAWGREIERIQSQLVGKMVKGEKVQADFGDETLTGTLVAGEDVKLDAGKLKRRVGAERFNKVTTPVVDRKKLEAAMLTGLIAPEWVAECSEVVSRKKYILITRKRKPGRPTRRR